MPGSVANAAPTTTLPVSLSISFSRSQTYELLLNQYANGETQRKALTTTSRKSWSQTRRLTPAQMTEMRTFYLARTGPLEPFYFYDPYETVPKFTLTPSGTQGRYVVRFDGVWSQQMDVGRGEIPISLIELA